MLYLIYNSGTKLTANNDQIEKLIPYVLVEFLNKNSFITGRKISDIATLIHFAIDTGHKLNGSNMTFFRDDYKHDYCLRDVLFIIENYMESRGSEYRKEVK